SPPALAVARAGEQTFDDACKRLLRTVRHKIGDLGFRRREPRQVERGAPEQREPLGGRRGGNPLFLQLGEDEVVDRILDPAAVAHGRRLMAPDRLKRPEGAPLGRHPGRSGWDFTFRPRSAEPDPGGDVRELLRVELAGRRHLELLLVAQNADEAARLRAAGRDYRAVVAPAREARRGRKIEPAHLHFRTVTRMAARGQQRPDLTLEQLDALARLGRKTTRQGQREGNEENPQHPGRLYSTGAPLTRFAAPGRQDGICPADSPRRDIG